MTSARHGLGREMDIRPTLCDLVQEPHHLVHEPHHRPVRRVTGRSRYRASPGRRGRFRRCRRLPEHREHRDPTAGRARGSARGGRRVGARAARTRGRTTSTSNGHGRRSRACTASARRRSRSGRRPPTSSASSRPRCRPTRRWSAFAGDFTSVLFPLLARSDLRVRLVEDLDAVPGALRPSTALVAVSAVQSADGRVADLAALREAAARCGALTLIDSTQASGWLPLAAGDYDFVTAGRVQVAAVPARQRVHDDPPGRAGAAAADRPRMVRGRAALGRAVRRAAPARRRRETPGPLTRLADLGGNRAGARVPRGARDRGDPRARRRRSPTGPGPRSGWSPAARRCSRSREPWTRRRSAAAGCASPPARVRCAPSFHLYNSEADADALADAALGR